MISKITLTPEDIIDLSTHLSDVLAQQQTFVFEKGPTVEMGWVMLEEQKTAVLQVTWKDPDIAKELLIATSNILKEYIEEGYIETSDDILTILNALPEITQASRLAGVDDDK